MLCSLCNKNFGDNELNKFITHLEYTHSMKYKYECPVCKRSFTRRDNFKSHLRLKHNNSSSADGILLLQSEQDDSMETDVTIENNSENELRGKPESTAFNAEAKALEFENLLKESVLRFITNLYNEISIPRSFIQKIIDSTKAFLNAGFLNILKDFVLSNLNSDKAVQLIDFIITCFKPLDSEYKRLKFFEASDKYIEPQSKIIGSSADVSKRNNETSMILKHRTCTFIPVSQTLQQFLSLPGVLKCIQDFVNKSYVSTHNQERIYNNVLDGSLWEEVLQQTQGRTYIPLILYFDDFETSNPLGSHAGVYKVGVVYFSIAALPPQFMSRLENIFTTLIFHSSERNEFGNQSIFNCLLEDLQSLAVDGIVVNNQKLYFNVILLVGDNLGVNSVLGFVESFSAHYFCRICTTIKAVTQQQTDLDISTTRLKYMYDQHAKDKVYGIKEHCIWNVLAFFHVYHNQSLDIMHDLFEGIHRYDMALIIGNLLQSNAFSLDTLNSRVKYFKYEFSESNHPPAIKREQVDKGLIIFSASEMEIFVRNFRYYVGDLVPDNNKAWLVYLELQEVTEILSQSKITSSCIVLLETLIPKYLENLRSVFPNITLKPKHHLLLHYPAILRKVGPVSKISCERFEAKHRELKRIANSVTSRKNIPLTLGKKCQMQFATRCISMQGCLDDRISSSKPIFDEIVLTNYQFVGDINLDFYKNRFYQVKWCEKNGIRFITNDVILFLLNNTDQYFIVRHILMQHDNINNCHLICEQLSVEKESCHYRSLIVDYTNMYACLKLNDLNCRPTIIHQLQDLKLIRKLKYL